MAALGGTDTEAAGGTRAARARLKAESAEALVSVEQAVTGPAEVAWAEGPRCPREGEGGRFPSCSPNGEALPRFPGIHSAEKKMLFVLIMGSLCLRSLCAPALPSPPLPRLGSSARPEAAAAPATRAGRAGPGPGLMPLPGDRAAAARLSRTGNCWKCRLFLWRTSNRRR